MGPHLPLSGSAAPEAARHSAPLLRTAMRATLKGTAWSPSEKCPSQSCRDPLSGTWVHVTFGPSSAACRSRSLGTPAGASPTRCPQSHRGGRVPSEVGASPGRKPAALTHRVRRSHPRIEAIRQLRSPHRPRDAQHRRRSDGRLEDE